MTSQNKKSKKHLSFFTFSFIQGHINVTPQKTEFYKMSSY